MLSKQNYAGLVTQIEKILQLGRIQAVRTVNNILVQTYWQIGRHIVEFEQNGKQKPGYGTELIDRLSKDLTLKYGKGFSRSNLFQIRSFYIRFPKIQTLSGFLSWSHYSEILKSDDVLEANFYAKQCEQENWSVRELKRQMNSMLFQRVALSKDKKGVLALAQNGIEICQAEDVIKEPYVFEFLGVPQRWQYKESELEDKLIQNLEMFLLEMGKGFAFIGRQYRVTLANTHYYVDLVFYHRILKCFVLIDLKHGEIKHGDIGQMNLYLNYFRKEENTSGDNEPIGIVLGARKNQILVEYATEHINNKLFVSKYQLYLPNKKQLEKELRRLLD